MIWLIDVCDLHRLDASEGRLYEIGLGVRELPEARSGSGRDLIVGRRVPRRRHLEGAPPLRSRTHQEVRVAVRPRINDCGGLRSLRVVPRRVPYCLLHFEKISSGNFRGKCRNCVHKSASRRRRPCFRCPHCVQPAQRRVYGAHGHPWSLISSRIQSSSRLAATSSRPRPRAFLTKLSSRRLIRQRP